MRPPLTILRGAQSIFRIPCFGEWVNNQTKKNRPMKIGRRLVPLFFATFPSLVTLSILFVTQRTRRLSFFHPSLPTRRGKTFPSNCISQAFLPGAGLSRGSGGFALKQAHDGPRGFNPIKAEYNNNNNNTPRCTMSWTGGPEISPNKAFVLGGGDNYFTVHSVSTPKKKEVLKLRVKNGIIFSSTFLFPRSFFLSFFSHASHLNTQTISFCPLMEGVLNFHLFSFSLCCVITLVDGIQIALSNGHLEMIRLFFVLNRSLAF